jgi:hypothetical integral membrane protein (TIGR02206 family)
MVKYQKESIIVEKVATILMLILQFTLYGWYIIGPESLLLKALPLYTCRIVLYLFAIGLFFNNKFCLKLGSYWGFYGGLAGLFFPTIFNYQFPHILQTTTVMLHIYIMLMSGNYLFVKNIGSTKSDVKCCCVITTVLLTFNTIINFIFGTNYTSTTRMPLQLIKVGINVPSYLCLLAVVVGYLLVTIFQHIVINNYAKKSLEKTENKEMV